MSLLDVKSNFLELEEAIFRAQWLTQEPQGSGMKVFYLHPENRLAQFVPFAKCPVFVGVDYGRTSAAVVCQVLPNGSIVVFEEHLWYNLSTKQLAIQCATQIARRLKEKHNLHVSAFVIDPRIMYALQNEFLELGLNAIAPWSGSGSNTSEKRNRVAIVNSLLTPSTTSGLPKLLFHAPNTPHLLRELSEMNYKMGPDGSPTDDLPEKGYHLTDALLYVTSYIYNAGIHKEMEGIGESNGEAFTTDKLLISWLERGVQERSDPHGLLSFQPLEAEEEALEAVREGIRRLVSSVMQQMSANLGGKVPPQVEEKIAEEAFHKIEDYAREKVKTMSPPEVLQSLPPELEKELLELSVRELDRLQMMMNLPTNPFGVPDYYTILYDRLLYDIIMSGGWGNWGGGGGFFPPL